MNQPPLSWPGRRHRDGAVLRLWRWLSVEPWAGRDLAVAESCVRSAGFGVSGFGGDPVAVELHQVVAGSNPVSPIRRIACRLNLLDYIALSWTTKRTGPFVAFQSCEPRLASDRGLDRRPRPGRRRCRIHAHSGDRLGRTADPQQNLQKFIEDYFPCVVKAAFGRHRSRYRAPISYRLSPSRCRRMRSHGSLGRRRSRRSPWSRRQ